MKKRDKVRFKDYEGYKTWLAENYPKSYCFPLWETAICQVTRVLDNGNVEIETQPNRKRLMWFIAEEVPVKFLESIV